MGRLYNDVSYGVFRFLWISYGLVSFYLLYGMVERAVMKKRRHRQIGRLLYYYCCVRYMVRIKGEWVKDEKIQALLC